MTESLNQFLTAVRANDLSRMSNLWGTERGPAAQWMRPEQLRQRLTVIQRYLNHVGYRVVQGPVAVPGRDDLRTFQVELQRERCNRVVPIDIVRTRSGGWLVLDVHLEAAGNPVAACPPQGTGTGP